MKDGNGKEWIAPALLPNTGTLKAELLKRGLEPYRESDVSMVADELIRPYDRETRTKMAVLGYVGSIWDRHSKNFMTSPNGKLLEIDMGRAWQNDVGGGDSVGTPRGHWWRSLSQDGADRKVIADVYRNRNQIMTTLIDSGLSSKQANAAMRRLSVLRNAAIATEGKIDATALLGSLSAYGNNVGRTL